MNGVLGKGRSASRTLPREARERARALVDRLLESPGLRAVVTGEDKPIRLVGRAKDGGLRIDGGPGGNAERTVALNDLGRTVLASDDVAEVGGILDEHRVHRRRYIDGAPKGSTRWNDTPLAVVLVRAAGTPGDRGL